MKPTSARSVLGISLVLIVGHWLYQILTQQTAPTLPDTFSALVLRITVTKIIVLSAIALLLKLGDEGFAALGLRREGWSRHVLVGAAFGVVMFVGLNVMLDSILRGAFPSPPPSGRSISEFFVSPANLIAWLPIGIFGGGVVEELQRIFIITRFEKWLGRNGLILGVILSSAMFGFGHRYQGVGTALSTAVSGLAFAFVYLRRRSAIEPITAHALSDVLAMLGATMLARG